jgi:WD40-like Beta Propeller Repeat
MPALADPALIWRSTTNRSANHGPMPSTSGAPACDNRRVIARACVAGVLASTFAACGRIGFSVTSPDDSCAFAAPVRIAELSSVDDDRGPALSPDARTLFFTSDRFGMGAATIVSAEWTDAGFGALARYSELEEPGNGSALFPTLAPDGLEIVYWQDTAGGSDELRVADRANPTGRFAAPRRFTFAASHPALLDELTLFAAVMEPRPGTYEDLAIARRNDRSSEPEIDRRLDELNEVNTYDTAPTTRDGLELFFASDRLGNFAIFRATRPTPDALFGPPMLVGELYDETSNTSDPELSPDRLTLYFSSDRGRADNDLWYAVRPCVP